LRHLRGHFVGSCQERFGSILLAFGHRQPISWKRALSNDWSGAKNRVADHELDSPTSVGEIVDQAVALSQSG
jgi:hypothetical protein